MRVNEKQREGFFINLRVVLGGLLLVSVWFGMSPLWVESRVPPLISGTHLVEGEGFTTVRSNQSWSAFRSDEAKSICVTVTNYGVSEIFVHLFRKRSLTGAFTVLPQRVSAMCSDVTVIEVECGDGTCLPRWFISESN